MSRKLKARELVALLLLTPDAEVRIGFEEFVRYSELTGGSEDRIEPIEAVYQQKDGSIVLSFECYLNSQKLWPK